MICDACSRSFSVSAIEQKLLQKVFGPDLPSPPITQCSACRMRQRLAFRNERKLYRSTCAVSGKPIISLYRPGTNYTVYDQSVWWSDAYDPLAYGFDFDFSQPFFPQLQRLHVSVPKVSIHNAKSENCEFTNYSAENRNCYLVVGGLGAEDCLYSYRVFYSKNITDCFGISKSELCYECLQSSELYNCLYSANCHNSSGLYLCEDCIGCRDCLGCVNLRHAQDRIFNERLEEGEYLRQSELLRANHAEASDRFAAFRESLPLRSTYTVNCEESLGDQIRKCRRCNDVFFLSDSEDVRHGRNGENNRDCADINFGDNCELQYQASNLEKNYRVAFAALAWYVSDSYYVLSCFNSDNLFGCCGMKRNEYCILNKQYSPREYERMVGKIVSHMQETGEWGRFFPPSMSPFLFDETVAAELFPLSDAECIARGYHPGASEKQDAAAPLSAAVCSCCDCGRSFRIIAQESKFYEQMRVSPPAACQECRHRARINKRRPMELTMTSCSRCSANIPTSVQGPDALCERCFNDAAIV